MKLLLSNDDGILSSGIHALAKELEKNYEIAIVAPDAERSGVGHSFTYKTPLRVRNVTLEGIRSREVYSTNGMPADCVKIGCNNLRTEPDMVVSGINIGANLGTDVFYSGTFAAAMEAVFMHRPSIAVSIYAFRPKNLDAAAHIAARAVEYLRKHPLPEGMMLNVNVPDLPLDQMKGVRRAKLCFQEYRNTYDERTDPRGVRYFWLPMGKLPEYEPAHDTDEYLVRQGYISVTPIGFDIADYDCMKQMDLADFTW